MVSPFRTTGQLGPNLSQVVRANQVYYDSAKQIPTPQWGVVEYGDDGFEYMWVKATGAITAAGAPGTQVALTLAATSPRATAAAGSGGWYAPSTALISADLAAGDSFWARKGTAP